MVALGAEIDVVDSVCALGRDTILLCGSRIVLVGGFDLEAEEDVAIAEEVLICLVVDGMAVAVIGVKTVAGRIAVVACRFVNVGQGDFNGVVALTAMAYRHGTTDVEGVEEDLVGLIPLVGLGGDRLIQVLLTAAGFAGADLGVVGLA